MFFFFTLSVLTSCDSCVPRGKINFLSKSMSMSMTKSVQKIMLYNLRSMSSLSLSPSNRLQSSGRSRPSDKGAPGHPDPEIGSGDRPQKNFFRLFGPYFGLKVRGGPAPPCSSPRSCNQTSTNGHVSTTATFFLADSPYIDSYLNLSTTATFFCPQSGR